MADSESEDHIDQYSADLPNKLIDADDSWYDISVSNVDLTYLEANSHDPNIVTTPAELRSGVTKISLAWMDFHLLSPK